ncbi:MAG: glutamine--tRNA ligase [Flavobacteriaceae bacterium]
MGTYKNFIEQIIEEDLNNGFERNKLCFRFPPEPNGYLHIGHVKAITLNFELGKKYNAPVNLRFDDTNPVMENEHFVQEIKNNIKWLGYKWSKECYASDYFEQLYNWAHFLISNDKAYVDSQSSEKIALQKGTPTKAGTNSPFRNRPKEESTRLFTEMREGKHKEGSHVLRAKIKMDSQNMLMRDPVMYRILFKDHHRTGSNWCIYPMYDWAHGESDFIEKISHSLCTLEFKPHRDLYEWFLQQLPKEYKFLPKQREFARLNMTYTIMSKRKLLHLIEKKTVSSWDDPRMPTISGMINRGYPPKALINFVKKAGIAKRENTIDVSLLEFYVREELNKISPRVMVVTDEIKLVIINYPDGKQEKLEAINNPEDESQGKRQMVFSKYLYIEREDFRETANRKFFRLTIGKEVRLKNAYIIKGETCIKNNVGEIVEIHCTYDPKSKSGSNSEESKRKVKGTIHWVDIKSSIDVTINEYDKLFISEKPEDNEDLIKGVNTTSKKTIVGKSEKYISSLAKGQKVQFQRKGYYIVDNKKNGNIVFNKTVSLRDSSRK